MVNLWVMFSFQFLCPENCWKKLAIFGSLEAPNGIHCSLLSLAFILKIKPSDFDGNVHLFDQKKAEIWISKQKSPFGPVYDLFLEPSEPRMAWSVPIWPGLPTLTYPHSKLKPEYDEFDEINEKSTLNCILIFLSQLWLFLTCFWPDTAMRVKFFCWF